jgi:hypothetical protein
MSRSQRDASPMRRKYTTKTAALLLARACCFAVALLFILCSSNDDNIAGNGSQAGNGRITCSIYNSDGSPASNASVYLRTQDYTVDLALRKLAVSRLDAHTDARGMFSIDSVDTGSYSIEVNDVKSHAVLLNCVITLKDTLVNIPSDTLQPTGTIKGVLPSIPNDSGVLYIRICGLERVGVRDTETGSFVINDVPPGSYTLRVLTSAVNYQSMEIRNIKTAPSETTDIGKIDFVNRTRWLYSKLLYLNTSPTGADLAGNVMNFPILIRLRGTNFDFNTANVDGSDLRFSKANGVPLPYEIERWDAASREAEIWVKVDTVHGNDSTHFIEMYWGNAYAVNSSSGSGVFDTSAGFAGVWHMGENGESINDATGYAFNGENSGSTKAAGIIGNSRNFTDGNSIKIPGLLKSPPNVTLSAWVQSDKSTGGQDIISIGDAVLIRLDDINGIGTAGCYHNDTVVNDTKYSTVSSGQYLTKTGWHYIVFSINATTSVQTLYIDGAQYAITYDVNQINYTGLGTDTYIGIHGNGKQIFNFTGQIDEVRVNNTPVSSDWIKLCFMDQKEQGLLIQW